MWSIISCGNYATGNSLISQPISEAWGLVLSESGQGISKPNSSRIPQLQDGGSNAPCEDRCEQATVADQSRSLRSPMRGFRNYTSFQDWPFKWELARIPESIITLSGHILRLLESRAQA